MFSPGIETFFSQKHKSGISVAIICNNTSRDRNGIHLSDLFAHHDSFELKRIFTPEHGFESNAPDGEQVSHSNHQALGVEIFSLYGKCKKLPAELLQDIDLLVYDIQDVGVRFYTYISTLRNAIEAAADASVPIMILDRPDILGGRVVEGPMLHQGFSSFVSHLPVALRYAMTPAELALWWKAQAKLDVEIQVSLCNNYAFPTDYNDLQTPWFKPSPSMPGISTAMFYPGTCLYEGTNVSEGRGTRFPFQMLGAPWINSELWLEKLSPLLPQEIKATKSTFIPTFSKYAGKECHGILLSSETNQINAAVYIGVASIHALMRTHPGKVEFSSRPNLQYPFIDYLAGTDRIRKDLIELKLPDLIIKNCQAGIEDFIKSRSNHLLYRRD